MKRFVVFLCLVLLCSCANKGKDIEAELISRPFKSKAEIIWQQKRYEGEITRSDFQSLKLELTGDDLKIPICYEISQGGYKAAIGELEYNIPFDDAQPQAVAVEMYRAFIQLRQANADKAGDLWVYKTPMASLQYDKKQNLITYVETQNGKIIFKDFLFVDKQQ